MKAAAVVKKTYENGNALIEVVRKSACSGDCGSCHGCAHPEERVQVLARNTVSAVPGDRVTVESDTKAVLARAMLLYMFPVALMLVGALIPASSERWSVLYAMSGLLAGLVICVVASRKSAKLKNMTFAITEVLPSDNLQ